MGHKEQAYSFANSILKSIRKCTTDINKERINIPRWVQSAGIRIGQINDGTIIFFEQRSDDNDAVVEYRNVNSDVDFVFPQRTSTYDTYMFDLSGWTENTPAINTFSNTELTITKLDQSFTNVGSRKNHMCIGFFESILAYQPQAQIEAVRYIPCALFIPSQYLSEFDLFWNNCRNTFLKTLISNSRSSTRTYQSEPVAEKGVMSCIDDTVIILGNYSDPYEDELREVRDQMRIYGYDSFLIKELPSIPSMSLEETVRLWTTASRFCVMVDREASGHIKEYEMVKNERKPLVFFRPKNSGSTWMIGDDDIVDLNYIKKFEFADSPLTEVKSGVQWAEDLLRERGNEYPEFYPWKDRA